MVKLPRQSHVTDHHKCDAGVDGKIAMRAWQAGLKLPIAAKCVHQRYNYSHAEDSVAKDVKSTPATPAVVMTSKGATLAEHLDLKNLPLATTPGGRNFAMKALHPSDHEIKSTRVPGGNCLSVALCSDQVTTIPLASANSQVEINLIPNIIEPCSMVVQDGALLKDYAFFNAAFGGSVVENPSNSDLNAICGSVAKAVEKYRITSQSVTVELIAPSLSDQGTITAAQYNMPPRTESMGTFMQDVTSGFNNKFIVVPDVYLYERPVLSNQMVLGTQAYTAKAREGTYMPLKLTTFKWRNVNDPMIPFSSSRELATRTFEDYSLNDNSGWPFHISRAGITNVQDIYPLPKCCGHNFGFISVEGCAANVALRVRVRQTVEIGCRPSSTFAPLLEVALPPDETCLKMYFEVSSRMADAYPASYNDLGKLKSFIMGIAKKIGPYVEPVLNSLSLVPGPVGAIASGAKAAVPLFRSGVELVRSTRKAVASSRRKQ